MAAVPALTAPPPAAGGGALAALAAGGGAVTFADSVWTSTVAVAVVLLTAVWLMASTCTTAGIVCGASSTGAHTTR